MEFFITDVDWVLMIITCAFILLDIISGFVKACVNHDIRSGKMWLGIMKKAAYFIIMVLAILCEYGQQHIDLGLTVPLVAPACALIILTELASILENVKAINPDLNVNPFFKLFNVNHEKINTPKHLKDENDA